MLTPLFVSRFSRRRTECIRNLPSICLLIFAGCGSGQLDSPPSESRSSNVEPSSAATESPESLPVPKRIRAVNSTRKDTGNSPFAEEAFATAAGEQLRRLNALLLAESVEAGNVEPFESLVDQSFSCTALRPDDCQLVFDNATFQVWQSLDPAQRAQYVGPEGFGQALMDMAQLLDRTTRFDLSFHIVDARVAEESETLVHVELNGNSTISRIQQDAHWLVTWKTDNASSAPQILSIQVKDFEETILMRAQPWFRDATRTVFSDQECFDRQFGYSNTYWRRRIERHHIFDKSGHHGIAIGDVNQDGLDDIYVCQPGGLPNRLLVQQPDGTVADISARSTTDFLDNTRSALIIDFDNNATQDLILATVSGIVFLSNDGTGRFRVTNNITAIVDAYSMAAADYDNDGDLDIFACRYHQADADPLALPIPTPYFDAQNGGKNYLIRNNGNWRTSNATTTCGLDISNNRFSYAAIWIDYDLDGDQDLYVVNDFGRNNLYRNDLKQSASATFTDVSMDVGMRDGAFGMSATVADYDRDGREDIYVSNMFSSAGNRISRMPDFKPEIGEDRRAQFRHLARGNTLLRNRAGEEFEDVSVTTGVTMGRWSWGSLFADIDNDGWQDLVVANGYITGDKTQNDL